MDRPATQLNALSTTATSATVLVATRDEAITGRSLTLETADTVTVVDADSWQTMRAGRTVVWCAKATLEGLPPGDAIDIDLIDGGETLAECAATTLPDPRGRMGSATLVVGSCFDVAAKAAAPLETTYGNVTRPSVAAGHPIYNMWCGDQVYVDAPWKKMWRMPDARKVILRKYIRTWGLRPGQPSGFAAAMSRTANWYLPDDHEFWNGYPHPSLATLPADTLRRVVEQLRRFNAPRRTRPHPHAQGPWGRAAGEAYCLFQSDLAFDPFSESVCPPQLQTIDLGMALVVLADTRWHRTIRKTGKTSGFMVEDDLDELCRIVRTEPRLLCLSLSRPIVGRLPHRGAIRGKVEYSPEDYPRQYGKLWRALVDRATAQRPTLVFGGDVHRHSVRTAVDNRLLEVVSSPLAHLAALARGSTLGKVSDIWAELKGSARRIIRIVRNAEPAEDTSVAFPVYHGPRVNDWEARLGESHLDADEDDSGIAAVTVQVTPAGTTVEVRSVRTSGGPKGTEVTDVLTYRWNSRWESVG